MSDITSLKDALGVLQSAFHEEASHNEKMQSCDLAYQIGTMIHTNCTTEKELAGTYAVLNSPSLQRSFIRGVRDVVGAPNNQDSLIAHNLRPFAEKTYQALLLAR